MQSELTYRFRDVLHVGRCDHTVDLDAEVDDKGADGEGASARDIVAHREYLGEQFGGREESGKDRLSASGGYITRPGWLTREEAGIDA